MSDDEIRATVGRVYRHARGSQRHVLGVEELPDASHGLRVYAVHWKMPGTDFHKRSRRRVFAVWMRGAVAVDDR